MINEKLINPGSIVVIGGSDDLSKPGGKVLKNLIDGNFQGELFVVNPKQDHIQGVKSYKDIHDIPPVDLAILAVQAKLCLPAVEILLKEKNTLAFIIISAGFSESGEEGKILENKISDLITRAGGCLIGPNCIGVITRTYNGVFTRLFPGSIKKVVTLSRDQVPPQSLSLNQQCQKGLIFRVYIQSVTVHRQALKRSLSIGIIPTIPQ